MAINVKCLIGFAGSPKNITCQGNTCSLQQALIVFGGMFGHINGSLLDTLVCLQVVLAAPHAPAQREGLYGVGTCGEAREAVKSALVGGAVPRLCRLLEDAHVKAGCEGSEGCHP